MGNPAQKVFVVTLTTVTLLSGSLHLIRCLLCTDYGKTSCRTREFVKLCYPLEESEKIQMLYSGKSNILVFRPIGDGWMGNTHAQQGSTPTPTPAVGDLKLSETNRAAACRASAEFPSRDHLAQITNLFIRRGYAGG